MSDPVISARAGHRDRLLGGMAAAVREKGFRATTLADVVRHAGVSRRTFYEHFVDPVDCYLALIEEVGTRINEGVAAAMASDGPLAERVDRAVGAYLDSFAVDPDLGRSWWTEAEVTGQRGRALTQRMSRATGQLLHELVEAARAEDPRLLALTPEAALMLAAGLRELVLLAHDGGQPLDDVRATGVEVFLRGVGITEPQHWQSAPPGA